MKLWMSILNIPLKERWGYDKNFVKFFVQEEAPCCTFDGKVLLEEKGKVATSPNGNGGWFNSLLNNHEAEQMLEKYPDVIIETIYTEPKIDVTDGFGDMWHPGEKTHELHSHAMAEKVKEMLNLK